MKQVALGQVEIWFVLMQQKCFAVQRTELKKTSSESWCYQTYICEDNTKHIQVSK